MQRTRWQRWQHWLSCALLLLVCWCSQPLAASATTNERQLLTPELLQERLAQPTTAAGMTAIDLSHLRIDLSNESDTLGDRFYTELRAHLERSAQPLLLDFSDSTLQGELALERLAQSVPLVSEALTALLTAPERERLPANLDELQPYAPDTTGVPTIAVLRCALKLADARLLGGLTADRLVVLQAVQAPGAIARGPVSSQQTYFAREVQWSGATFSRAATWSESRFLAAVQMSDSQFQAQVNWTGASLSEGGDFSGSQFRDLGDWQRSQWHGPAQFARSHWYDRALFSKSRFLAALDFSSATFEKAAAFRSARFNAPVQLTEVNLLNQIDFSDAVFADDAVLAADNLAFDSDQARVLGDKGKIGSAIQLSALTGNENVLRNLVRNFRRLEQIADANQLEYQLQQLRLRQLSVLIGGTPLDWRFLWRRGPTLLVWAGLSVLLLLSQYGTSVYLVLSSGGLALACFSLAIWALDRWRRAPSQIRPSRGETLWMLGSASLLLALSGAAIAQLSSQPLLGLLCLSLLVLPVPLAIAANFYRRGGDRDQRDEPYLMENGSERQLGLAIVRLPVMPKFAFFRDRYSPIPWGRRWNWLNYYGFALNVFLKISFNDLRLRDERLPGSISAIAWYQWSLGILYIALLLWTLSRTIPGLNLLIYLS